MALNVLKRYSLLLGVVVLMIVLNLVYFYGDPRVTLTYDRYYIVSKDNVKDLNESILVQIEDEDIILKLADYIREDLSSNQELMENLRQKASSTFSEEYLKNFKKELDLKYTNQLFKYLEKNLQLYEQLSTKFFLENKQDLMDYLLKDLLKNLPKQESTQISNHINDLIEEKSNKKSYYRNIIQSVLLENAPQNSKVSKPIYPIPGNQFREVTHSRFSYEFLTKQRVSLKPEVFEELQNKHDLVVKLLKNLPPPPSHIVKGDGIVINGGGSYLASALVVIGQIKEMGSQLPIELILDYESEYDKQICEDLLPKFNGSCLIIERELGKDFMDLMNLKKFQLKSLGLLLSSFDNTIALDADSFPIKNIDSLINNDIYLSKKFILFPDMWHKGTSPLYYDIARFEVGEPVRRHGISNEDSFSDYSAKNKKTEIMFHDLDGLPNAMATESGQMILSKRDHFRSLLLSTYYNINGPSHYWPLLYQGGFGLGDKDTFVPALHVFNEPYYLVDYEVWFAGRIQKNGEFLESTIVQHDPQQSVEFYKGWRKWLKKRNMDTRLYPFQDNDYSRNLFKEFKEENPDLELPESLFLHMHRPKIDPITNTETQIRHLGLPGVYEKEFGKTDWELRFRAISQWLVCEAITSDHYWNTLVKTTKNEVCSTASEYVEFLKQDSKDLESANLKILKYISNNSL